MGGNRWGIGGEYPGMTRKGNAEDHIRRTDRSGQGRVGRGYRPGDGLLAAISRRGGKLKEYRYSWNTAV
jgi:hypothetical protein